MLLATTNAASQHRPTPYEYFAAATEPSNMDLG